MASEVDAKVRSPLQGRCDKCEHYHGADRKLGEYGHCDSLNAEVLSWWTGCIRWKPMAALGKEA